MKATHVAASKIVALSAPHLPKQQKLHQFQRPRCAGQRLKSQTGGDSPGDRHQEDLINGNGQRDKVHSTFNLQFVIVSRGGEREKERKREHKTANRKRHPAPAGTRQSVCQRNVIIFFGNTIIIRSKKKYLNHVRAQWHFQTDISALAAVAHCVYATQDLFMRLAPAISVAFLWRARNEVA